MMPVSKSNPTSICVLILLLTSFLLLFGLQNITDIYAKKSYDKIMLLDPNFKVEAIAKGLKFSTGMAMLDNGDMLVIEKDSGNILRIQNGIKLDPVLATVTVANTSERGLLGIAISKPVNNFIPCYVFLYFTEKNKNNESQIIGNNLYRYELIDNALVNPKLLLKLPAYPGPSHNGGVLKISPDNKALYLVIGNVNYARQKNFMTQAQNVKNGPPPDGRGGILRVTFDGEVVGGNGILGETSPLNKYFAYGIRNSFGIGFDDITGYLWDTENGQSKHDEINLVLPGFNSGSNVVQGMSSYKKGFNKNTLEEFNGNGIYSDPEFEWLDTIAPTSILFLNSKALGPKYQDDLFVGSVKNGTIYHFELNKNRTALELSGSLSDKIANTSNELAGVTFAKNIGLITDLEIGVDGYMYVLSNFNKEGTIFRIGPK